ncbi:MAG: cyclically-permuted mutarotase family protein [Clostridiales bacterium]|nr:cyclically-permuted mutarotase family protein [Clostridiales bacterium]
MRKRKQVICALMAALVVGSMTGCTSNQTAVPSAETQNTQEGTADQNTTENNAVDDQNQENSSKTIAKIRWQHAGDLEPQQGMTVNKGTAGMLSGRSNGYIIVGGGANFPDGGPEVGGAKKTYPDIYVLKQEDGMLVQVNHTTLDREIGYGASITTEEGIYYVGGSPTEGNKILLVKADTDGNVTTEEVGTLPFTFSDGIAVKKDNIIYIGAGKQDGKATNRFYAFDLSTKEATELEAVPGEETRTQVVTQILNDSIYVFSGGDKVAYTDGYRYDLEAKKWEKVSDVKIGEEAISLLGANSVKLNDSTMLVIGGFNKAVYDNAVAQMAELKDEELQQFKNGYFGADPSELKWNRKILIYDATVNEWSSIGEVPFDAPCGEALILDGDQIYSINGEIKPGTRTNHMYSGTIEWE